MIVAIIVLNVVVFIIDSFILNQAGTNVFSINHLVFGNEWGYLTEYGRLSGTMVLSGDWWRIITNLFLHSGAIHLLVNMIMLWIFGRGVEKEYGKVKFVVIYLVMGILVSLITMNFTSGSVGASGAIWGCMGILLAFTIFSAKGKMLYYGLPQMIATVIYVIITLTSGRVTMIAHGSGLIVGVLIGTILEGRRNEKYSNH